MDDTQGIKNQLENARQANKGILAELDAVKAENSRLHNELDKIRQRMAKTKDVTQELDRVRKENESPGSELDNVRQDLDKGCDMDLIAEIQDLKSRVVVLETTMQGNVSQSFDKNLAKEPPEFVDNWKVVFKEPYWKLYKVINGKLIWIHIGRVFKEDVAREKIQEKLAKLDKGLSKDS